MKKIKKTSSVHMDYFKKGDRVFDIRYGWGVVGEKINMWNFSVDFFNNELPVVYSFDYAEMILSYTEYKLDGHSLEKPELTWKLIYSEWSYDDSDLKYREFLEQNFEPPVRKCK
jgi:hypothetical protein